MTGLDYAGRSPGAAAVKAAGFGFVARYLSRYTSKVITAGEYQDMTNNGVGVVLVFEDYANQALNGYNQGVSDAQFALAQARGIGWPEDRPIHFAVDFDISDAQKPIAGQYMRGVASVLGLGRTGAYGGYWWIKYCADNNLAAANARWQAVAWSGGNIHPTATLFQQLAGTVVNGTSCDINQALKADFGQNIGVEEMIQDTDNEYARWARTSMSLRARMNGDNLTPLTRQEFRDHAVGLTWLHALEILEDDPEADNALETLRQGSIARRDNWPGQIDGANAQIKTLQAQIADLQKQLAAAPNPDEVKKLQDQLATAQKQLKDLQDQGASDTATGNRFLQWFGGILKKLGFK